MEHLLFLLSEAEINTTCAIDESRFNLQKDLHAVKLAEKEAALSSEEEDVTAA